MMTQEDVLKLGIRAGSLLDSDIVFFIEDLKSRIMEALSLTQPHEQKTRESLYFQHKALQDLVDSLHQYVQAATQISNGTNAERERNGEQKDTYDNE